MFNRQTIGFLYHGFEKQEHCLTLKIPTLSTDPDGILPEAKLQGARTYLIVLFETVSARNTDHRGVL